MGDLEQLGLSLLQTTVALVGAMRRGLASCPLIVECIWQSSHPWCFAVLATVVGGEKLWAELPTSD